jgi:hypothetical protein
MTKIRRLGHSDHQFLVWRNKVRQSACTWGTRSIPINVHEREIPEVRRPGRSQQLIACSKASRSSVSFDAPMPKKSKELETMFRALA